MDNMLAFRRHVNEARAAIGKLPVASYTVLYPPGGHAPHIMRQFRIAVRSDAEAARALNSIIKQVSEHQRAREVVREILSRPTWKRGQPIGGRST